MERIGNRLREERCRLKLNQAQMAERGGVRAQAQVRYEKGDRKPDALYLAGIAANGVDVQYVLTGGRSVEVLSPDESQLISHFRELDRRAQSGLLACATGMAPESQAVKTAIHFNGPVAQQIQGAVFNEAVSFHVGTGEGKKI